MATHIITADEAIVLKAPRKKKLIPSLPNGTEVTATRTESGGVWVQNDWNYDYDEVWIDLSFLSEISNPDPDPEPEPTQWPEFFYLEDPLGNRERYNREGQ